MFEFAKMMYLLGEVDKDGLQKLVDNGRITVTQMAGIIGEKLNWS